MKEMLIHIEALEAEQELSNIKKQKSLQKWLKDFLISTTLFVGSLSFCTCSCGGSDLPYTLSGYLAYFNIVLQSTFGLWNNLSSYYSCYKNFNLFLEVCMFFFPRKNKGNSPVSASPEDIDES